MKKWFKIAATLLLAAIVLAVCALLSGGIDIGKLNNVEYEAAEYICTEDVISVKLCDSSQDIEILPSDDGKCRLEYVRSGYDDYEISLTDGLLSVRRSERFHLIFSFLKTKESCASSCRRENMIVYMWIQAAAT